MILKNFKKVLHKNKICAIINKSSSENVSPDYMDLRFFCLLRTNTIKIGGKENLWKKQKRTKWQMHP